MALSGVAIALRNSASRKRKRTPLQTSFIWRKLWFSTVSPLGPTPANIYPFIYFSRVCVWWARVRVHVHLYIGVCDLRNPSWWLIHLARVTQCSPELANVGHSSQSAFSGEALLLPSE